MDNLQVKVENLTGNELIIREGSAIPLQEPKKIEIQGDINSISAFLSKRPKGYGLQFVDETKVIVLVDKKAMHITLMLDPENVFGTMIKGSLELSDELKVWSINQSKTWKREELVNLIKFNRLSFDDNDKHAALLKAYMAFEAKAAIDSKAASDTRGNKANSFSKEVSTNLPTEFILLIPIFKGKEAQRFRVEICLDLTDGGARFWFESTELHELIETTKEIIFNEELKSCQQFVIINK